MKKALTLICFLLCAAALLPAQTTTEVVMHGDTILVRSVSIDEVAVTPEKVNEVVSTLTQKIAQAEAQLIEMRRQLTDMVKVQALVDDRARNMKQADKKAVKE